MTEGFPLSIESIPTLVAGLAIVVATIAIAALRRIRLPVSSILLSIIGLILLSFAAGGISCRQRPADVVVVVDQSPSTRGASFHDERWLNDRLHQLLGGRSRRITHFSDAAATETIFSPPAADAIVLFSDGRFQPPEQSPPVFAVIDPELETPQDGRIGNLEERDGQVVVHLENPAQPRVLRLTGTRDEQGIDVAAGSFSVARPIGPGVSQVTAALEGNDRWPENDRLALSIEIDEISQRWWVGKTSAGADGWRHFTPDELSADLNTYLAPAIIVLENIPPADLSDEQQDRLMQYARDLGGSIVLVGGDRAFAGGAAGVDRLEELSPLSGDPPVPVTRWILLADSSGSMAAPHAGRTRWAFASDALLRALAALPPSDSVMIGSFARELSWWSSGKSVSETREMPLPPTAIHPSGQTNLQAALEQIAETSESSSSPTQLLLLTDAQASIDDPARLAEALRQKGIHLHLLATAPIDSSSPLRVLVEQTGGSIVSEDDPARWAAASRDLLQRARPAQWMSDPIVATFHGALAALPTRELSGWNRTWLKPEATMLAEGTHQGQTVPLAATWRVGVGQVTAVAFAAERGLVDRIRQQYETSPRDPRFQVAWTIGPSIEIRVDAQEERRPINDLSLSVGWPGSGSTKFTQTAPGRYEASVKAPREPVIAQVVLNGSIIDRKAIAGRYAPEFEAIGNDRAALHGLADRSGGRVIEADDRSKIQFPLADRRISLVQHFTLAGAGLLAAALIAWRLR